MKGRRWILLALLLGLTGCGKAKEEPPPPVRPVLSIVVAPQAASVLAFAGTVEPRYKVSLGFRVLGRIITRDVNVSDLVVKGQRLAALDPTALELGVRTAQAELSSAVAQLTNATASEARQRTLLEQNTTAQAQYDLASQAREAATAAVTRAQANRTKAREQLSYAELRSDFDGVVTAIDGEVGQVVAPGQAVMQVARPETREAVVDVPQKIDGLLKPGTRFKVALQIDPSIHTTGRVREIAPQADPTTRTRRVKIALDNPPANFRLGTTITASLIESAAAQIRIPASALLERAGKALVWVVNPDTRQVFAREVHIARRDADEIQIADGLSAGTRVVVAGVHSLAEGQGVRIYGEAAQ